MKRRGRGIGLADSDSGSGSGSGSVLLVEGLMREGRVDEG